MKIKLKICGLRNTENVQKALAASPDYLGFIFYNKSPRYVGSDFQWISALMLPSSVRKVGVFVNEEPERIMEYCHVAGIDIVQLHGQETVNTCLELKKKNYRVIKVFSIGDGFSFKQVEPFQDSVDYFLFDTKTEIPGGSGSSFDWSYLTNYAYPVPFFLSGGIGIGNIENIKDFRNKHLFGIDVNSRMESDPGEKDSNKIDLFMKKLVSLEL